MSEPAYRTIPASETTAATLLEKAEATLHAAQRLRSRLHDRWQQVSDTVTDAVSETAAQIPVFKRELADDAQRLAGRARLYHETQPISALGVVAAAAFAVGLVVGLGRH